MKAVKCSFGGRMAVVSVLVILFFASVHPAALWAVPAKGTLAPPFQFEKLLQAPEGAHTDWASLKGKVVVIEFWATWCGPCVAAIPHLNSLVASLDPAKFQFVSVDDEDPKVVQPFLEKRPMSGWIGLDQQGADFAWYGAEVRPTTIIVDGKGRVVAATLPEELKAEDLVAVSEGKPVEFRPLPDLKAIMADAKPASGEKPVFEISLSKSAPDAKFWMTAGGSKVVLHAVDAKFLLTYAYHFPYDRLIVDGMLPEGKYDLRAQTAGVEDSASTSMIRTAVVAGLGVHAEIKKITRKVYVLKATDDTKKLLLPTASNGGGVSAFGNGKISLINTSMEDFAFTLEGALEIPVVDETGMDGKYDVEVEFPDKDVEAAKIALRKKLGISLDLVDRSITVLSVMAQKVKPEGESVAKPVAH